MIKTEILKRATKEDLADINRLVPQLALTKKRPARLGFGQFKKILSQDNFRFIAVRRKEKGRNKIVAFGTVHWVYLASGLGAETGDLVVDEKSRALGLGRLLLDKMIDLAEKSGARHVSLRTNPKRKDALKMYDAMGLKKWKTNFYRINFPQK